MNFDDYSIERYSTNMNSKKLWDYVNEYQNRCSINFHVFPFYFLNDNVYKHWKDNKEIIQNKVKPAFFQIQQ